MILRCLPRLFIFSSFSVCHLNSTEQERLYYLYPVRALKVIIHRETIRAMFLGNVGELMLLGHFPIENWQSIYI